jgi:hypothetical protein
MLALPGVAMKMTIGQRLDALAHLLAGQVKRLADVA